MVRVGSFIAFLLLVAFAANDSGASPETTPASEHVAGKLGRDLAKALTGPLPSTGIAIAVTLKSDDLPLPGASRRAAIALRQQRILDSLPASSFLVKHRYESVSGLAGWAQPAAVDALLAHSESERVYIDGTVHATLAEGSSLIGAPSVHSQGFTGAGIRVAVLDTGIDSNHPHLSDDLAAQQCFCDDHPAPTKGCCPSGGQQEANAEDDEGHGTSTSGIITSSRGAGTGVAPDAEIIAVKVLNSVGSGSFSDIAAGLDWLITNHVSLGLDVVNMSLGDGSEHDNASASPCSGSNTANAIQSLHALGIPVFVSSGNDGHDNGIAFPACVAEAISVGGVYDANVGGIQWCGNATCTTILCTDNPTFADRFVCHTNSGSLLDVLAPNFKTATTALGGGTEFNFGGTSASSPYAAAEAALLLEADPTLTPDEIRTLMKTNGPLVTNPENSLSFTRTDVSLALQALAPATCGNNVVEVGENCDDGNIDNGDCCSSTCQYEPASSVCRVSAGTCDIAETCTGSSGTCPADAFEPVTTECRAAAGACDAADFCDGATAACTAGAKLTSECRGSAGVCDIAEVCDGLVDDCPADAFEPVTTECRAAASVCDIAESCTGSDPNCSADQVLDAVPCRDGDVCNGDEMCEVGICASGPRLDCNDGNACTADSCDGVSGCAHTPIVPCDALPTTSSRGLALLIGLMMAAGALATRGRRAHG